MSLQILKIGGGRAINLEGIADDLAACIETGQRFVVVLGANAVRDALGDRLGLGKTVLESVAGYQSVFSDDDALDLILMAYAGLRAKRLVESCRRRGVDALSLAGIDGALVSGARNRGIRVRDRGKTLLKRDLSGKPREINTRLLRLLIDEGYTPIVTIPIVDEKGFAINSENDDIVTLMQSEIGAERVIQLIEAPGFLADASDPSSVVTRMGREDVSRFEAEASGRMKRKMLALRRLVEAADAEILIADGRVEHPVRDALAGSGTRIAQGARSGV